MISEAMQPSLLKQARDHVAQGQAAGLSIGWVYAI